MKFFRVYQPERCLDASVVTIGNFDGIHLGHQKLQGKKINQVIRLLSDAGITLDSIPLVLKQGIYCKKPVKNG